jgi:hypothetical protein
MPSPESLTGRWVHAHEEDSEGRRVYRPADFELPPARGRQSLDLRPGGVLVEGGPGPADVPEEAEGRWELDGDTLVLHREHGGARRLEVVSVARDRLVLSG